MCAHLTGRARRLMTTMFVDSILIGWAGDILIKLVMALAWSAYLPLAFPGVSPPSAACKGVAAPLVLPFRTGRENPWAQSLGEVWCASVYSLGPAKRSLDGLLHAIAENPNVFFLFRRCGLLGASRYLGRGLQPCSGTSPPPTELGVSSRGVHGWRLRQSGLCDPRQKDSTSVCIGRAWVPTRNQVVQPLAKLAKHSLLDLAGPHAAVRVCRRALPPQEASSSRAPGSHARFGILCAWVSFRLPASSPAISEFVRSSCAEVHLCRVPPRDAARGRAAEPPRALQPHDEVLQGRRRASHRCDGRGPQRPRLRCDDLCVGARGAGKNGLSHLARPRLASPCLASPRALGLAPRSPLAAPRLAPPRLASPRLAPARAAPWSGLSARCRRPLDLLDGDRQALQASAAIFSAVARVPLGRCAQTSGRRAGGPPSVEE